MSASLGQPPWLAAPATQAVLDALEARGGDDCARLVGGCVRNTLIEAPVADIDIATRLTPGAVIDALAAAGLKSVPTGLEHGTVTAISSGRPYEITTLRRDVSTDGRRAVVAFTDDWAEDAARRDFTLNALYSDRSGQIFDPTGQGVADARAGRIVFVGEPEQRIREDYLRILRFFRFYAWYGKGAPDTAALRACAALQASVANLSAERKSRELLKLLAAPDPRLTVAMMEDIGLLDLVIGFGLDLSRFEGLVDVDQEEGFAPDPVLRLAALLPDDPGDALEAAERLRLSNAEANRLALALAGGPQPSVFDDPPQSRRHLYELGAPIFEDRVKLAWARTGAENDAPAWRSMLDLAKGWVRPVLPVTGQDAMAAGAAKGPAVGEALRRVQAWWAARDFIDGRETALEKLAEFVKGD